MIVRNALSGDPEFLSEMTERDKTKTLDSRLKTSGMTEREHRR